VRRSSLIQALERVPAPTAPRADLEQAVTPSEAAADLLFAAVRLDDLPSRSVVDLGCGTGRLAIGAALLGAAPVTGVDVDPQLVLIARRAAEAAGATVRFEVGDVATFEDEPADVVLMNPPFGAQRRHADRPFWEASFRLARRTVHAFALRDSRTFIAHWAVARKAQILENEPVHWELARTFPHHTRDRIRLPVDRWAITLERRT
jgi:putative methylase